MTRTQTNRRGVILLIVLTLLVLFSLIGITFLVVSSRYRASAVQFARHQQAGDPPSKLLEDAMGQLLYGPRSPRSALWLHHILADLYGSDGTLGTVTAAAPDGTVANQFLQLSLAPSSPFVFPDVPNYYNGCVLTVLDGNARGYSTRVVSYAYSGGNANIRVEAIDSDFPASPLPANGNRVWINGHPFNGTGAGFAYNGDGTVNRLMQGGQPIALLPNYGSYVTSAAAIAPGGLNESYDIADFQNMFLAFVNRATGNGLPPVMPSFHRPDLCAYWATANSSAWTGDNDFIRAVVLRPLPSDHPNFSGSNPAMTAAGNWRGNLANLSGFWDVDNDSDGTPDSIWVDLGFPAVAGKDGRMYKPLFAFLVEDLDGRANVNAWGHNRQITAPTTPPASPLYAGNAGATPINVKPGQGFGPAEIHLPQVLAANQAGLMQQRYNPNEGSAQPGKPFAGTDPDVQAALGKVGWPRYSAALGQGGYGAYGGTWDILGQSYIGVDHAGHPLHLSNNNISLNPADVQDSPYEIDLLRRASDSPASVDQPYTLSELEVLLRGYDADASKLPRRLLSQDPSAFGNPRTSAMVTTTSSHIPASTHLLPSSKRNQSGLHSQYATHLADLLAARLKSTGMTEPTVTTQVRAMLPWEILKGGRMDINRWLGNGPDSQNASGYVWEFGSLGVAPAPGAHVNVTPNYLNNDPLAPGSLNQQQAQRFAKQIYARQLYVLMRLLTDDNFVAPSSEGGGVATELTAQRIAQWAVNVVDYRDFDSIMTGFEYDVNPWNGWNVDGDLTTTNDSADRRVAFGVEYPDLVLTEAIAFHDKRLKDTNWDADSKKRQHPTMNQEDDTNLDQFRIPQGSLFFELYCARAQQLNNPLLPTELYDNNGLLMLDALAPASPNVGNLQFPVWRIAISRVHTAGDSLRVKAQSQPDRISFQPTDLASLATPVTGSPDVMQIERYVWFTTLQPQAGHLDTADFSTQDIFYNRGGSPRVAPSRYAVVGPRTTTYFGVRKGSDPSQPDPLSLQRIDLAANSVQTTSLDGTATTRTAVGIVCGAQPPAGWTSAGTTAPQGIGLNVTEPLPQNTNYYIEPTAALAGYPVMDGYYDYTTPANTVHDDPFDYQGGRPINDNGMQQTGTYANRHSAIVQRLADPTQPYDPNSNPYISLDYIPIDTTVFNGEDREPAGFFSMNQFDPTDADPYGAGQAEFFSTREKGSQTEVNIWNQNTVDPSTATNEAADADPQPHYFRIDLMASVSPRRETFGALNGKFGIPLTTPAPYIGGPPQPFPWLPIANRPFVSPYELLLVPSSTPGRLMHEFSLPAAGMDPYAGGDAQNFRAPYGYLLNFLHTSNTGYSPAANFHRLFDYVEVPSHFNGTVRWYNSTTFAGAGAGGGADFFRPPYNKMSRFQDPGLVNINTILDSQVWEDGAGGGVGGGRGPAWATIATSRAGAAGGPSIFGNPFRSSCAADLVPIDTMRVAEVDATLLRRNPPSPGQQPLFADTPTQPYNSIARHPYFRYETLMSLGNKVKTTSNVFAVWITVGYFEVNYVGQSPAIPDGWQLGQERGIDTGEVQRHRAFYILDRSVPVAAQPGEANNTERAVLLRRYID